MSNDSQPLETPVPEDMMPYSEFPGHQAHTYKKKNTHIHEINLTFKKEFNNSIF